MHLFYLLLMILIVPTESAHVLMVHILNIVSSCFP